MLRRRERTFLSPTEKKWGGTFLFLYLFVFPKLSEWIQRYYSERHELLLIQVNLIYYGLLFLLLPVFFRRLLKEDLFALTGRLPESLATAAVGALAAGMGRILLDRLPLPVADPLPMQYAEQYRLSPGGTLVLILLLIPLVEETVYRGFVYGCLREYSRPLAMAATVPFYALAAIWRYAVNLGDARYLWLAVLVLPVSVALDVAYERGIGIWGCALIHGGYDLILLAFLGL